MTAPASCGAVTEFDHGFGSALAICTLAGGHEVPHFDDFEMYYWK